MLILRTLLSRLSLATRSGAPMKTIPALANSGVGTHKFSVKTDLDGDGGGGSSNKESNAFIKESNKEVDTSEMLAKDYDKAGSLNAIYELEKRFPKPHGVIEMLKMYDLYKENPEIYSIERLAKDFGVSTAVAHHALFIAYSSESILWSKSPTPDCLETHRPPLTDLMKEALAKWRANINSTRKKMIPDKELFKQYKRAMSSEYLDDE